MKPTTIEMNGISYHITPLPLSTNELTIGETVWVPKEEYVGPFDNPAVFVQHPVFVGIIAFLVGVLLYRYICNASERKAKKEVNEYIKIVRINSSVIGEYNFKHMVLLVGEYNSHPSLLNKFALWEEIAKYIPEARIYQCSVVTSGSICLRVKIYKEKIIHDDWNDDEILVIPDQEKQI